MPLVSLKCINFRCLQSVEVNFSPGNNLIHGSNASGKTSILEAIGYLGRARSFRGARNRELIRHGADEFLLTGRVEAGSREVPLGVRNSRKGLEVHADGEKCNSAAVLAEALPLQIIDPDIHELVAGGPEGRRRYIDWIAFHVEPEYLDQWRRFRRALRQRNAAIRGGGKSPALSGWDREFVNLAEHVDSIRSSMVDILNSALEELGEMLLGSTVSLEYQRGWPGDKDLTESLKATVERDIEVGSTQVGPHRGDLRINFDARKARKLISRGQQKLLACCLVIAATEMVQTHLEKPLLLLVDDPTAELDTESVERLMVGIENLGCQVIATTLNSAVEIFSSSPKLFHVEHGSLVNDI